MSTVGRCLCAAPVPVRGVDRLAPCGTDCRELDALRRWTPARRRAGASACPGDHEASLSKVVLLITGLTGRIAGLAGLEMRLGLDLYVLDYFDMTVQIMFASCPVA